MKHSGEMIEFDPFAPSGAIYPLLLHSIPRLRYGSMDSTGI